MQKNEKILSEELKSLKDLEDFVRGEKGTSGYRVKGAAFTLLIEGEEQLKCISWPKKEAEIEALSRMIKAAVERGSRITAERCTEYLF